MLRKERQIRIDQKIFSSIRSISLDVSHPRRISRYKRAKGWKRLGIMHGYSDTVNTRTLYVRKGMIRGLASREAGVGPMLGTNLSWLLCIYIYTYTTASSSCLETVSGRAARGIETGLKSRLNVAVLSRALPARKYIPLPRKTLPSIVRRLFT